MSTSVLNRSLGYAPALELFLNFEVNLCLANKFEKININSGLLLFEQDISRSKCPVNVMYAQEKIIFSLGVRLYGNFNH